MSDAAGPPQDGASQKYGAGAAGEPPSPPLAEREPGGERPTGDDPKIQRAVRRSVGIAALRRIRRIVDAEQAQEAASARWARRLSIVFILAAVLALAWMVTR